MEVFAESAGKINSWMRVDGTGYIILNPSSS
jgi:hypothetical protein